MFHFPLRGFFRPHSATPSDQAAADTSQSKSGARPLCSRCAHSAPSTAQRSVPNASTPRAAAVIRCARNVRLLCAQQEGAQTKPRILRCQRGKSLSAAMKSRDLCRAVPRSAAQSRASAFPTFRDGCGALPGGISVAKDQPQSACLFGVSAALRAQGVCGLSTERCLPPPSAITGPELLPDTEDRKKTECLALVIAWSAREPHRVGEIALLLPEIPVHILGRDPASASDAAMRMNSINPGSEVTPNGDMLPELDMQGEPVVFFRQRPQALGSAFGPESGSCQLLGDSLSRRQLAIRVGRESLLVRNIGRCRLSVSGQVVREATVRPGDTLYLRNQLLLYCTNRPLIMPALKAYPRDRVPAFGEPDREGMIGESPTIWKLRDRLAACAKTGYHVLVVGESGSGKELAAQAVHHLSVRAHRKLIADNIAAIPPSLAAALLFGNKKNFPNPGMEERAGLLGSANGSSLFLDEIGDMPEEVQPMFLRVTERNGEYFRLGEESKLQRSDFRLIGATNRPEQMRYELKRRFQREIRVPGVNSRKEDIPLLIRHLLKQQAATDDVEASRFIAGGYPRVHPLLVEQLLHHTYKTHVSEIMFLLGQAMAESDHDIILPLGSGIRPETSARVARTEQQRRTSPRPLPTIEEVKRALDEHKGHITRTANSLDISRDQLNRLIRREGLQVPQSRKSERSVPG